MPHILFLPSASPYEADFLSENPDPVPYWVIDVPLEFITTPSERIKLVWYDINRFSEPVWWLRKMLRMDGPRDPSNKIIPLLIYRSESVDDHKTYAFLCATSDKLENQSAEGRIEIV